MRLPSFAAVTASLTLLSACANQNAIYRNSLIAGRGDYPAIVTVDAKQRHLITAKIAGKTAVCAEASPDTFSALSTSLTGSGGIAGIGGPTQEVQSRAALALAESAGTIERTQTINLLRESMYRTCERYLSGGIDGSEMIVQAARDQRAMVAVLAIEQLTGAARRQSTILLPGSTSARVKDSDGAIRALQAAAKARSDAERDMKVADTALADLSATPGPACATLLAQPRETAAEADRLKFDSCKALTAKAKAAADNYADKSRDYSALMDAIKAGAFVSEGEASTGAGTKEPVNDPGGGDKPASASDLAIVAEKVASIVTASLAFNEVEMMCVRLVLNDKYGSTYNGLDPGIKAICEDHLKRKSNAELSLYEQQLHINRVDSERAPADSLATQILAAVGVDMSEGWRDRAGAGPLSQAVRAALGAALTKAKINVHVRNRILNAPTLAATHDELGRLEQGELDRIATNLSSP